LISNADPDLHIGIFTVCNVVYAVGELEPISFSVNKLRAICSYDSRTDAEYKPWRWRIILSVLGVELLFLAVYAVNIKLKSWKWASYWELSSLVVLSVLPGLAQLLPLLWIECKQKVPLYSPVYQKDALKLFSNDYTADADNGFLPESTQGEKKKFELLEELAFSRNKKYLEEFLTKVPSLFENFVEKRRALIDKEQELQTFKVRAVTAFTKCETFVETLFSTEDDALKKELSVREKFAEEIKKCFP
jgi:hypothetical protein